MRAYALVLICTYQQVNYRTRESVNMSNRFAAGLTKLKDVSGKVAPQVTAPVIETEQPAPAGNSASELAPSRKGKVAISAYFDPAVRQQLAILAVKQNKSQAAMMAEALNLMFERYGEPTIARA
jgi:hypothetical protein